MYCQRKGSPCHEGSAAITLLRWIERVFLVFGLMMLFVYVTAFLHGKVLAQVEIERFILAQQKTSGQEAPLGGGTDAVDFKFWSRARIAGYEESLKARFAPPLAVLRIAKIRLTVPVLEGTDELTLNRAVGHITGTTLPGQEGNTGIAGHRDGFFRGLKDIKTGDEVTLLLLERKATYIVDRITIVEPNNVEVLRPGDRPSLTLVTCYPFYFVGDAPQRYIVHAALVSGNATAIDAGQQNASLNTIGLMYSN